MRDNPEQPPREGTLPVAARAKKALQKWKVAGFRFLKAMSWQARALRWPVEFTDREGRPLRIPFAWIFGVSCLLILWLGLFDGLKLSPKPIAPEKVWQQAQREGERVGLDPGFIYAICWAESSLNAHARSRVARGIMQLTREAWKEVGAGRYGRAFDWERNMRAGVDYLAFCRDRLESAGQFSYARLAAAYRYGPYRLQAEGYDLKRMPEPRNVIYRRLFAGERRPVEPPDAT